MNFNKHLNLEGTHAFLSASGYHWINYEDDKLKDVYLNRQALQRGTELHEFAETCIKLKQKLPRSTKTLNQYVNDAIGFGMSPEVVLYYSDNCYGTADAIKFSNNQLRIHDLKTGQTPAHMEQLFIYAALFCLEYHMRPSDLDITLRIYQFDDFIEYKPQTDEIAPIMDKIVRFDKIINDIRKNGEV